MTAADPLGSGCDPDSFVGYSSLSPRHACPTLCETSVESKRAGRCRILTSVHNRHFSNMSLITHLKDLPEFQRVTSKKDRLVVVSTRSFRRLLRVLIASSSAQIDFHATWYASGSICRSYC